MQEGQMLVFRGVQPTQPRMAVDPDTEEEIEIQPEDQDMMPLGVGPGSVFPGTEATVVLVDEDGDLAGVGEMGVPTLLVEIKEPHPTLTENGWEVTMVPRYVSVPLDQAGDLFEEVS